MSRCGTILLVEDEQLTREAAGELLRFCGYNVLLAADGQDALHICEAQEPAIDLIVCDVIMPRLGGPALFQAMRERGSDVPFVFVSGFLPGDDDAYRAVPPEIPMLQKPWQPNDLLRVIGATLRR
jgi:two-component system response regulator MprA